MLKVRVKLISGILLLAVLSVAFFAIQFLGNSTYLVVSDVDRSLRNVHDIAQELNDVKEQSDAVMETMVESRIERMKVYASAMQEIMDQFKGDQEALLKENGAIVRVNGSELVSPEGIPEDLVMKSEYFAAKEGWFLSDGEPENCYFVYYCRMDDGYYFIEWERYDASPLIAVNQENSDAYHAIEETFGIRILCFRRENDERYRLIYIPDNMFESYQNSTDSFGITHEMLEGAVRLDTVRNLEESTLGLFEKARDLVIDGETYRCYFLTADDGKNVEAFMIPYSDTFRRSVEKSILLLIVVVIIAGALLSWAVSTHLLVRKYSLSDTQKAYFTPRVIRRKARIWVLAGLLILIGLSAYLQCVFASFDMESMAEKSLHILSERLSANKLRSDQYQKLKSDYYEQLAALLGDVACLSPEYLDQKRMSSICDMINADYIILYDENGVEKMSNSVYLGLSLTRSGDDMRDFRRLLRGVPSITKLNVTDEVTGLTRDIFGVSVGVKTKDGLEGYEALLLVVDPTRMKREQVQKIDDVMETIVSKDSVCFSVDPESKRITASSDPELLEKNALDLGLPEDALRDSYMGFFTFAGTKVYGKASEEENTFRFYLIDQSRMYVDLPIHILLAVVPYLILMGILAAYMLFGYGKVFEHYSSVGGELLETGEDTVVTPSGKSKISVDPARRWVYSTAGYGSRTPFHNAMVTVQILYMISVGLIALYNFLGGVRTDNSVIAYILRGNWSRGLNLFAVTSILILFIEISTCVIILRALIRVMTAYVGTKGETICRLVQNFVSYLSVILFVYFALSYIGIDTRTLVASIGIGAFALSLGAQDLVKDILAGLTIVFEGEYQVGDIIELNGFRGTVLEVGVRSTKIEGSGGNILIIGNRDIKNVINMTWKNSWYPLDIHISESKDIRKVEELLREHLPKIGESIPEILSGPIYRGIKGIGKGTLTLSVTAECNEADYFKVERKLNRAIIDLFDANGINLQ